MLHYVAFVVTSDSFCGPKSVTGDSFCCPQSGTSDSFCGPQSGIGDTFSETYSTSFSAVEAYLKQKTSSDLILTLFTLVRGPKYMINWFFSDHGWVPLRRSHEETKWISPLYLILMNSICLLLHLTGYAAQHTVPRQTLAARLRYAQMVWIEDVQLWRKFWRARAAWGPITF